MAYKSPSSKTRKFLLSKYGHLYYPFKPPGVWYESGCVYCGNRAQDQDHIPPLSWLYALGTGYFESHSLLVVKVPACKECNYELGAKRLFTIKERTLYLLGRYLEKYEPFMKGIVWTDEELEELTGMLKSEISRFADCQRIIDRRIGILEENISMR